MARGRVYKRGSTWTWRVDDPRGPEQGARKQLSRGGYPTRKAAEAALAEVVVELRSATHVDPSKLTVRDHLDDWLLRIKTELSESGFNSYRISANRIGRHIGSVRLQDLKPSHVEMLKSSLTTDGLAPKTVKNTLGTLKRALSDAERLGLISRSPARVVKAPTVPKADYVVWSPEEIAQYLDHVSGSWLYTPVAIAALTGMRRGEVCGLRWSDIDLERGTLRIAQSITSVRGKVVVGEPKTESSRRGVTVGPALAAVLRARKAEQNQQRLAAGEVWVDSGLINTNELGQVIHPDRLTRAHRAAAIASGLPVIRFHDLRHSWGTNAMVAGIQAKVVSEQLGHASVGITLDTYTHVPHATARKAAEEMESQIFSKNVDAK